MKSSLTFTADGNLNTKTQRQRDIVRLDNNANIPETYRSNNTKEELCLEYVHSFIDQFMNIYPNRKIPYMIAENEYGVRKFVCSTLRPTQIPIPELYDMYECASFLAGYITYEPLEPQTETPRFLFSPQLVLDKHVGDCFDLANLLCSFLLGAGYDALIVHGYAPGYITLRDQTKTQCPMIVKDIESSSSKQSISSSIQQANNEEHGSNYIPPDNSVKNSKFLADLSEKKRLESIDTFQLWIPDSSLDETKMMEEEIQKHAKEERVHSWLLIRAGHRDIKEHLFIEPTTGRVYSVRNSPYIAIESVWNNMNYYINTKVEYSVGEIDYDLRNDNQWEQVFITKTKETAQDKSNKSNHEDHELMDEHHHGESEMKTIPSNENVRYFDAPFRWSLPLSLPRPRYLLKYPPSGKRTVQYYCAKADFFAKGINSQAMVMRIVIYLDQACTIVKEIHEWFENRVDRLYKRIRYFLDTRRFVEFYNPGSRGEIKKWTEYPGKQIEIDYYVNGRLDRLSRREEIIGQSVIEYFEGRTDCITYRSVILTSERSSSTGRQFNLPPNHLGSELYIVRMTLHFERNSSLPEGTDVSKRIFYVREGKAVFFYHFGKSQITGKIQTLFHTKQSGMTISENALNQEVGLVNDLESLQEAAALERECYSSIKTSFQLHDQLMEARMEGEIKVDYEKTVFEKALDLVDSQINYTGSRAISDTVAESKGTDFLSPFLRNVVDPSHLTREEALSIRQACLDALKARLVERANIIQSKLHEENAKLGKKQELFQRSQREGDFSTEEYEKYCTEAMFRIQILEQRLAAHEEAALRKFADLDLRLSNDPRLKVLKN